MNEANDNSVMTVREISEFLRLTEATVYKLLQEGKLPGRKVGGQWRCSRKAIEGWLGESDCEETKARTELGSIESQQNNN